MSFLCFHYYFCRVIHFGVLSWFIVNLCVSACGWASLRTPHLSQICLKTASDLLGLELETVVSRHVGAGNLWSSVKGDKLSAAEPSLPPRGSPSLRSSSHRGSQSFPLSRPAWASSSVCLNHWLILISCFYQWLDQWPQHRWSSLGFSSC